MAHTSGVLLHITSLPGEEGVGVLGAEADAFLQDLHDAGQGWWQMLPVHPTIVGDSPFQGPSVFAGNPALISLARLVETGDLSSDEYERYLANWHSYRSAHPGRSDGYVEYGFLWERKLGLDSRIPGYETTPLRQAYAGFVAGASVSRREAFDAFCEHSAWWLDDYATFMTLKDAYGFDVQWYRWQPEDAFRLEGWREQIEAAPVEFHKYLQFVFDEQMSALCDRAGEAGITLVGDMAIYPAYDSADVWSGRDLFQLDEDGYPRRVAAVPPDYFSKNGQLWGNPLYRWGEAGDQAASAEVFAWWARRMSRELEYFDIIKIDHFRGFESYGAVDAAARSAVDAKWVKGPGREAFDAMSAELQRELPVIAEDLGIITDQVRELLKELGFPGMKVFMFADWETDDPVSNDEHPYLPHNVAEAPHTVYYTGTHDNETLRQKIEAGMTVAERANMVEYLDRTLPEDTRDEPLNWRAIRSIHSSAAEHVVIPAQDLLYLGGEARMNNPADAFGWWKWRLSADQRDALRRELIGRLRTITEDSGRLAE